MSQKMISVEEAEALIAAACPLFPAVRMPLAEAHGHVLREDICADRDLPPYERVTMDGIALAHAAWAQGRRCFRIAGTVPAGISPPPLADRDTCLEVMTGAVLPPGADCVVRVEDLTVAGGSATIADDVELSVWQNVHRQGSDRRQGDVLLRAGACLLAPQLQVPATTGRVEVLVNARPRIAVIATGDELRDVHQTVAPHQIRQSNTYAIRGALQIAGYRETSICNLRDDRQTLRDGIAELLASHDLLILSGGVSMGKFDLVPEILDELQVVCHFHKVRQRPGKPLWFGTGPAGQPVFGLPGNPVSAVIGFYRYIWPQLQRSAGLENRLPDYARLAADVVFNKPLTYFVAVSLSFNAGGQLLAIPVPGNGSGDLAAIVETDGFVELPPEPEVFPAGTIARLFRWRL